LVGKENNDELENDGLNPGAPIPELFSGGLAPSRVKLTRKILPKDIEKVYSGSQPQS